VYVPNNGVLALSLESEVILSCVHDAATFAREKWHYRIPHVSLSLSPAFTKQFSVNLVMFPKRLIAMFYIALSNGFVWRIYKNRKPP
jgi:hypothetical protein